MSDKKYMVAISDKVVLIQWAEFCWRSYNFQTTISFIIAVNEKGYAFYAMLPYHILNGEQRTCIVYD